MKTKKLLALLLCAMMFATSFACAQPAAPATEEPAAEANEAPAAEATEAAPAEKIELVFSLWGDPAEQETSQKALDVYNNLQDKVHVTALQIGRDEYNEKLQTMATAGAMPDCGIGCGRHRDRLGKRWPDGGYRCLCRPGRKAS